jgi:hypothetical protein
MKKLVIILLWIPAALVYGQEVDYISSTLYSGHFYSLSAQSSFFYCGVSNSIQILSIADPENPEFLAGYPLTGNVYDLAVEGDYIFIIEHYYSYPSEYFSFLKSYEFSQPNTLIQLDSIDIGDQAYSIAISGDYAFIPTYDDRLAIADISDPWNLDIVERFDAPGREELITISGDYAFLATSSSDLIILDISDIQDITTVGVYDSTWSVNKIYIQGDYAYLAQGRIDPSPGRFTIIDITDYEHPVLAGYSILPASVWSVCADGCYAYASYCGEYGYGVTVFDVSNPASPNIMSIYDNSWGFDLYVESPYCYLVGGYGEPSVLNISDPQNPQLVGQYDAPGNIRAVDAGDSVAFVGAFDGLWTVDISDIHNPDILAHNESPGFIGDIEIRGDYAYACASDGLAIIDISDPSSPVHIGSYAGQYLKSVSITEYFVFAIDSDYGLIIIDIIDPANPTLISELFLSGYSQDLFVQGDYVYIANRDNGLYIVDITDISNPVLVGNRDTPGYAEGIYVQGSFAYIADGYYGLQIIDISYPLNPRLRFTVDTDEHANDVVVSGDYAIVAADSVGILVVDISEFGTPAVVESYNTQGRADYLKVVGDYIYVADQYSLMILYLDRQTGTLEQPAVLPSDFYLAQNYPNPFNSHTAIQYDIPVASPVVIEIFDILGRKVETLADGFRSAGSYTAVWNPDNVSSGLYFYRFRAGDYSDIRRMLLIK